MATKADTKADAAPAAFDVSKVKDGAFYHVQLSKSTKLGDDPLPAAQQIRLSGTALKQIADAVYSAVEIEEDAKDPAGSAPER